MKLEERSLVAYLNDHLAGSVVALELIERWQGKTAGRPLGNFLPQLLAEIHEDQGVLKELVRRLGGQEPAVRKAMAWLGEKALRLKAQGNPLGNPNLILLENLELLMLGIRGKLGLWEVLEEIDGADPRLAGIDFTLLAKRAREQHDQVEGFRRQAAREAFLGMPAPA